MKTKSARFGNLFQTRQLQKPCRKRFPLLARWLPYQTRSTLLSPGELAFYRVLQRAVNTRYFIAPKVRLADVVTCSEKAWEAGFGHLIARQHVDFVLCDHGSMAFVLAVELDDRSHAEQSRRKRDQFLNQVLAGAKIPLLRYVAQGKYDVGQIALQIEAALDAPNAGGYADCRSRTPALRNRRTRENRKASNSSSPRFSSRA